jgi:hypothetical protein
MNKIGQLLVKYLAIPLLNDLYKLLTKKIQEWHQQRLDKKMEVTKQEIAEAIENGKKGDISSKLHDL